jgi:hypothetical protein
MHPASPGTPAASPSATSTATPPAGWAAAVHRLRSALDAYAATGLPTGAESPAFREAVNAVAAVGEVYAAALWEADRVLDSLEREADEAVAAAEARLRLARSARCDFIRATDLASREAVAPCNPGARFEVLAENNPEVGRVLNASNALDLARELMAADFALGQTTSGCPGRRAIGDAALGLRHYTRPPRRRT